MSSDIIDSSLFLKTKDRSGFTRSEFRHLAGLFSRAASVKALYDIAVDVDFDANVATFTYYKSSAYHPYLQFVVRKVGPKTDMYELYKQGKGRIAKSGLFKRVYSRLEEEVVQLIDKN